jgi:hypothetical protein
MFAMVVLDERIKVKREGGLIATRDSLYGLFVTSMEENPVFSSVLYVNDKG